MSIGEVVAQLNAVRADIAEQQERALVAADRIQQAASRLAAVIGTSANPHARAAVQRFTAAAQRFREAAQQLATASETLREHVTTITDGGSDASRPPEAILVPEHVWAASRM